MKTSVAVMLLCCCVLTTQAVAEETITTIHLVSEEWEDATNADGTDCIGKCSVWCTNLWESR